MGRLPKNGIRKILPLDANILKTRHRHADTKYRCKVQYLYSKLREMSQNEAAKESLLNVTLLHIQALESEIIQKVGSDEMKNYQEDFVNFLHHEETLWKMKDPVKWWRKVEEALNSHDFIDNEKTDVIDSSRTKKTSRIPDKLSARSTKSKNKIPAYASHFSESSIAIPCFSKFNENLFIPHEEEPASLLSFEEQNYFSNEISAETEEFENYLF